MAEATAHGISHPHENASAVAAAHGDIHQEHPIKLYLVVWGWLFILSAASYMVDYLHVQGALRWSLILIFMMLKAGLIVAVHGTYAAVANRCRAYLQSEHLSWINRLGGAALVVLGCTSAVRLAVGDR